MKESRLERFAVAVERVVPDAISASVFMLIALVIFAPLIGVPGAKIAEAYYKGLWMLLAFTMQMTLIVTLGPVLGASPPFRRLITGLAGVPRTPFGVVALAMLVNCVLSYIHWGLGVTVGPLIAVHFCAAAERRGIKVDFVHALAMVYVVHSLWQYGISSSAPLLMASPGHFLEKVTGVMPLSTTIWSPAAIVMTIAFAVVWFAFARLTMPKTPKPISEFPDSYRLAGTGTPGEARTADAWCLSPPPCGSKEAPG